MKREMAKHKTQSSIRIIGGSLKRSKIKVINRDGLRPTSDRMRETMFNWLMPTIKGAIVLDCFSGSGVLGFEAISRGASSCMFIEIDREIALHIEANLERFKIMDKASVRITDARNLPTNMIKQADLIFVDPPFYKGMSQEFLTSIQNKVQPSTMIMVECEQNEILNLEGFEIVRKLKAGTDCLRLLRSVL